MSILEITSEKFFNKYRLAKSPKTIGELNEAFEKLKESIEAGYLPSLLIGKYIYQKITSEEIRTLRVTAHDFEKFLITFFEGHIMTTNDRKKRSELVSGFDDDHLRRVKRNALEKGDVTLGNLEFSVKTLVPDNKELNVGSFSAEVLFEDFLH